MARPERACVVGVTLVEMLIGIAILGVLLAVAVPSMSDMLERRRVAAVAGEITNIFMQARSEAASTDNSVNIHMQDPHTDIANFSCMRLVSNAPIDFCGCHQAKDMVCSFGGGRLLREYLLPKDSSVTFSASGKFPPGKENFINIKADSYIAESSDVQVNVIGTRTKAKLRIEYINSGRVRTCSPDGSMSGYPVCKEADKT